MRKGERGPAGEGIKVKELMPGERKQVSERQRMKAIGMRRSGEGGER